MVCPFLRKGKHAKGDAIIDLPENRSNWHNSVYEKTLVTEFIVQVWARCSLCIKHLKSVNAKSVDEGLHAVEAYLSLGILGALLICLICAMVVVTYGTNENKS